MAEPELWIHNSLGDRREPFRPRRRGQVDLYVCGPTVYRYAHVGNFRTYLMADFWTRAFEYFGYRVTQVQNITDVGHLVDDSETGDDKVLLASRAEGKTPAQIAAFYTGAYLEDAKRLGIRPADHYGRATDHVPQMVEMVARLMAAGHAYAVGGNVYFDVSSSPGYPQLSNNTLASLRAGHRIDVNPEKRHPADFLLWKAAGPRRLQVWESPWGRGFPGWHIECSAISLASFPDGFDVHAGGIDLLFPHHADEIAQSEALLQHRVARYWIHGEHLQMDEGGAARKMAKSAGNVLRVADFDAMGKDPLAFRYLCLGVRYRSKLRFSATALDAAARGLSAIRSRASGLPAARPPRSAVARDLEARFQAALADDLNLPAVTELLAALPRSGVEPAEQRALLEGWDRVLQLDLSRPPDAVAEAPEDVRRIAGERQAARARRDYATADRLRVEIEAAGWEVTDTPAGPRLEPRTGD